MAAGVILVEDDRMLLMCRAPAVLLSEGRGEGRRLAGEGRFEDDSPSSSRIITCGSDLVVRQIEGKSEASTRLGQG